MYRSGGPSSTIYFRDGEEFQIGELTAHVLHTPGHTPACVSYRLGDAVFVGDTLFMPDYVPRLLFPSIQINIRAGRFPAAESNGMTYLKIPISFAEGVHLPER